MKKVIYSTAMGFLIVLSCFLYYKMNIYKDQTIELMLTQSIEGEAEAKVKEIPIKKPEEETITFYIFGEVKNPDIYTMPKGSRINDAIEKAGGATDAANLGIMESIAKEIQDGQKIYVPNVADDIDKIKTMTENSNTANTSRSASKDKNVVVNINKATVEELTQIPGVGEVTAQAIYDYREENGDFPTIEEIKNVPRIGEKTFENMKNNITVD